MDALWNRAKAEDKAASVTLRVICPEICPPEA